MNWLTLGIGAAAFWALVALLDKFIIDREAENPLIDGIINSLGIFATLLLFSFLRADLSASFETVLVSVLAGFLYVGAMVAYFAGIKLEDVSRFDPVMSIDVVFILMMSALFLDETFNLITYTGIGLTLAGAFLISLENPFKSLKQFESRTGVLLAVSAAFLFAVREIILKSALGSIPEWTVIFWMAVGGGAGSLVVLATRIPDLEKQSFKGIEHLMLSGFLTAGGFILFIKSVNLGPVALVSTVTKTRYLAIFGVSAFLTVYHPDIMSEKLDRRTVIQKTLAILMVIAGVAIIAFQ